MVVVVVPKEEVPKEEVVVPLVLPLFNLSHLLSKQKNNCMCTYNLMKRRRLRNEEW